MSNLGVTSQRKRWLSLVAATVLGTSSGLLGSLAVAAEPGSAAGADLGVWKIGPGSAAPGGEVSWSITAANFDGRTVSDAFVTDKIPAGVTVTAASGCQVTSPVGGALPLAGPLTLTCPVGDLVADGADVPVATVTAQVADDFSGVLTNTATIASRSVPEIDSGDNTHTWRTAVNVAAFESADLAVWKSGPSDATAGARITWKLEVVNYAADGKSVTASDAVVTDAIPRGVTVTAAPGCWVADPVGRSLPLAGPFELACAVPELVPGDDSDWITLTTIDATVSPNFTGVLTNEASISSPTLNELEHTDNASKWSANVAAAPAPSPSSSRAPTSPTQPRNEQRTSPTTPTANNHPVTG